MICKNTFLNSCEAEALQNGALNLFRKGIESAR